MSDKIIYVLLLVFNCIVSAVSQVLLKSSARKEHASFWKQYLNVRVIVAYMMYIFVVVLNIYLLRYIPLIVAMPFNGTLPFILSIFFGRIFFQERITIRKIVGSLLIIGGIIVIVLVQG